VIGLAELLWEGAESTLDPVVVDRRYRRTGVGSFNQRSRSRVAGRPT
jgi:hypothetical protein